VPSDYTFSAYVGDHWEQNWMLDEYKAYVDKRAAAVWKQIAERFKDYSQKLILEPINEPTMWDLSELPEDVDRTELTVKRINELNKLFVDTVRKTGGNNKTRLLLLAAPFYNNNEYLSTMEVPKDNYIMVGTHHYNEMNIYEWEDPETYDYKARTDKTISNINEFMKRTGIPVIVGEVGANWAESDAVKAEKVKYFFESTEKIGVPCLWWNDYFTLSTDQEKREGYWIYNRETNKWERSKILKAIKDAVLGK
jgi:endoglucanase